MLSLIIIIVLLIPLLAVILDSELGRALAARLERRNEAVEPGVGQRVAALEAELERLSRDLRRLEEDNDFLHRLIEERPAPRSLAGPEHESGSSR
jgi:cell division protein FtsB